MPYINGRWYNFGPNAGSALQQQTQTPAMYPTPAGPSVPGSAGPGMYTPPTGPQVQTISTGNSPDGTVTTSQTTDGTGTPAPGAGTDGAISPVTGEVIGQQGLTGWAKDQGFIPEVLKDSVFENPWYLLPYIFKGLGASQPGYQSLRDIGGDPLSLFNVMWGANNMGSEDDPIPFVNFYADLMKNLGTSGGKGINAGTLLQAIANADTSETGQKTGLSLLLGSAGDNSASSRILFNLARDVINSSGMDPLQGRARQAGFANALDNYGSQALSQPDVASIPQPNQWLRENYPQLFL